jgi:hypothetical protein
MEENAMKDAKQFFSDFTDNELLRTRILEEMNRLIDDEAPEAWQAGQKAAHILGYDIPDEVAKTIVVRVQGISDDELKDMSEDEAKAIASGDPRLPACC